MCIYDTIILFKCVQKVGKTVRQSESNECSGANIDIDRGKTDDSRLKYVVQSVSTNGSAINGLLERTLFTLYMHKHKNIKINSAH